MLRRGQMREDPLDSSGAENDDSDIDPNEVASDLENNIEIDLEMDEHLSSDEEENEAEDGVQEFVCKSGRKWYTSAPVRRRRHIPAFISGPTGVVTLATTPGQVFRCLFTENMALQICRYTNDEALRHIEDLNKEIEDPEKQVTWKPIDSIEIYAFFGLLLIIGALRDNKNAVQQLWTTNPLMRRDIYTATMSKHRFTDILRFLRFDDKSTRQERQQMNKAAAISEIFENHVQNCKSAYIPGELVTVDEEIIPTRTRCRIRQYMKSKPAKYGIKVWDLVDAKSSYVWNRQLYTGKPEGANREKGLGHRVLCDMVRPLFNTKRTVTADNFFTSAETADYLLTQNTFMTGTVRANKRDFPQIMSNTKGRDPKSSTFIHSEDGNLVAVSYMPRKGKLVRVLLSRFLSTEVSADDSRKPNIILKYNESKGGVDTADKMVGEYTCARAAERWPMKVFFNIIDVSALNSFIIWRERYPEWNAAKCNLRQLFLLELGQELVLPHIERRSANIVGLKATVVAAIKSAQTYSLSSSQPHSQSDANDALGSHSFSSTQSLSQPENDANESFGAAASFSSSASTVNEVPRKRGRCSYCPRNQDKKTTVICTECKKFVCESHRKITITKIINCTPDCAKY